MDLRDYFISYNSADAEYAKAIDTALCAAGYSTHFAETDLPDGGNIPVWMDRSLAATVQVLALCSPDYFKPEAKYSEVERAATFWADPDGAQAMLVLVQIAPCEYTPLYAPLKRIDVSGMTPDAAAEALLERLKEADRVSEHEALRRAGAAPDVFHVPRRRIPEFLGREESLAGLHRTLSQGRNAAVTQAIAGLGGIGKTTLAAEYAHRFGTRGRYGGVWWLPAEAESAIVQGLADLAGRLGHPESNDLPAMARWALEKVAASNPLWLLVYDNVPNAEGLRYRLPSGETASWLPAGSARVLITSRASDFTGMAETTKLDQWDIATTADYLLRVTGRDDREGAEALAAKLDGLPLAADQAAAFLRERPGIEFRKYAVDLDRLLDRARDPGNRGDYPETVFATLVKSLEELPRETQDLLCLLAWLSPDGVDERLLRLAAEQAEFLPDPLGAALRDDYARADMLRPALGLSLLKADEDPDWGQVLILHRVVQAVLRVWQRAEGREGWDVRAAQIVNGVFPGEDHPATMPSVWPLCARLLSNARALAEHGRRTGEGAGALGRLMNQAGMFLHARGDTEGAIAMFEPGVELARRVYGDKHTEFATRLSNLAGRYADAGLLNKAEAGFRLVLEIEEKLLAPDDPSLAITLNNLGRVYWMRKDFARTEPLFQRARGIMESAHGELSSQNATLTNALGALYDDWAEELGEEARRAEARRMKEEALRIARAVRGERHPEVSTYLHNLAVRLARQVDFAGAAAHELRAAAIMLSLGLLEHPHTQERLGDLLDFWEKSGQGTNKDRLGELLAPEIAAVEDEMRAWVAEDPENRHFGPPPFSEHQGKLD